MSVFFLFLINQSGRVCSQGTSKECPGQEMDGCQAPLPFPPKPREASWRRHVLASWPRPAHGLTSTSLSKSHGHPSEASSGRVTVARLASLPLVPSAALRQPVVQAVLRGKELPGSWPSAKLLQIGSGGCGGSPAMSITHTAFGRVLCFVREWKKPVPNLWCPAMLSAPCQPGFPLLPVPRPEREVARYQGHCLLHLPGRGFLSGYSQGLQTTELPALTPRSQSESLCWGSWNSEGTPSMIPHYLRIRYERLGLWDCQCAGEPRSLGKAVGQVEMPSIRGNN